MDLIRTRKELETLLADNVTGEISPQDLRDFLASTTLRNEEQATIVGDGSVLIQAANGKLSIESIEAGTGYDTGTGTGPYREAITLDMNSINNRTVLESTSGISAIALSGLDVVVGEEAKSNSTYRLEVSGKQATDAIRTHIGLDLYPVPRPSAPSVSQGGAGNVDVGTHYYYVTFKTAIGETQYSPQASITITGSASKVNVTLPTTTDPRVTHVRLYRSKASGNYYTTYYVTELPIGTTAYEDNDTDASLTVDGAYLRANTTCNNITVAGTVAMTLDEYRVAFGQSALAGTTTGGRNTAIGTRAGQSLTTASDNTFIGFEVASTYTVTGGSNIAIGGYAAKSLTSGNSNVIIGHAAALSGTSLIGNVLIGSGSGRNTTGVFNTCVGYGTGYSTGYAHNNTFIGFQAGYSNTTGGNNVYLGAVAGYRQTTASNQLIIDNQDRSTAANELIKALIVGTFNADPANQALRINAGTVTFTPKASVTPANNGDLVIEATSNTQLTFKYKGSDGTVRSASLTLA